MAARPPFPRARAGRSLRSAIILVLTAVLTVGLVGPAVASSRPVRGDSEQYRLAVKAHQRCERIRHARWDRARDAAKAERRLAVKAAERTDRARQQTRFAQAWQKRTERAYARIKKATGPRSRKVLIRRAQQTAAKRDESRADAARARQRARATRQRAAVVADIADRARSKAKRTRCPKPVFSPIDYTRFNYPQSRNKAVRTAVSYSVKSAIANAPRGSRIRIATFRFANKDMSQAIVAAHRRGVIVQVLVYWGRAWDSKSFTWMRRQLGTVRLPNRSWVRTCRGSCLGPGRTGDMHNKMYLFSQVGRSRYVSMVSSANLTRYSERGQWNHLDTVIEKKSYKRLAQLFNRMGPDKKYPAWRYDFTTRKMRALVFPRPRSTDPVVSILRQISCRAPRGYGEPVRVSVPAKKAAGKKKRASRPASRVVRRTKVRVSMYSWFGDRGATLARLVRQKWNQGCDVKVVFGGIGRDPYAIMRNPGGRGRIPMRQLIQRGYLGIAVDYNHSKYVTIDGSYSRKGQRVVWTGSANFSDRVFRNDELLVRLRGNRVHRDYTENFRRLWFSPLARRPRGASAFGGEEG